MTYKVLAYKLHSQSTFIFCVIHCSNPQFTSYTLSMPCAVWYYAIATPQTHNSPSRTVTSRTPINHYPNETTFCVVLFYHHLLPRCPDAPKAWTNASLLQKQTSIPGPRGSYNMKSTTQPLSHYTAMAGPVAWPKWAAILSWLAHASECPFHKTTTGDRKTALEVEEK